MLAKGVFVPPSKPVVQPKRPIPAYMHWSTRNMKVLMAAEPGLKMIDSNKRSGLTWNSWGETEKAPYRAYKEEDVKRYERELK